MAEVWERREGETGKAHRAFLVYRDLGPVRSITDAYRKAKGRKQARDAPGYWHLWATRWQWAFRADQWDAAMQRLVDAEIKARVRDEVEKDVTIVKAVMGLASLALQRVRRLFDNEDYVPGLGTTMEMAVEAVKLHRLITGEATEISEMRVKESEDLLAAREELTRKIASVAERMRHGSSPEDRREREPAGGVEGTEPSGSTGVTAGA